MSAAGPSNDPAAERAEREDAGIINKISQYLARTTQILTVRLKTIVELKKKIVSMNIVLFIKAINRNRVFDFYVRDVHLSSSFIAV